jgi:hypothetical protein
MRRPRARIQRFISGFLIVPLGQANPLIKEEDFEATDLGAFKSFAVDLESG